MNYKTLILIVVLICIICLTTSQTEHFIDSQTAYQNVFTDSTIVKINSVPKHILTDDICRWPNELIPIRTLNVDHININDTPANTNGHHNTYCGGIDNYCSSSYDCCNNLYCRNGKCQI